MKLRRLVPLVLAVAALPAAELPLGVVEKVEKAGVVVRFDAAARLALGQMVALHGPGSVVKHPLTGKVVTEQRKLLAKGQIIAVEGDRLRLRVLWSAGEIQPEAGWDAVPLPGEAAPNAPPAASAALPAVVVPAGGTLAFKLPLADPDGDPLVISWELVGAVGRCGQLDARLTALPENAWTAPGLAPEGGVALKVTATDPYGQQAVLSLPLEIKGGDDPRRARKPFAGVGGGQEPAWTRLERADDGSWVGVDDGGRVLRTGPGWRQATPVALGDAVRRPLAAVLRSKELHVLDGGKLAVLVFTEAGQLRRTLGGLSEPVDLAVSADGTVFVADARAGGVLVFDAGGRYRACAGRLGDDAVAEVTRVCATAGGGFALLDAKARRLHRYDDHLRRLDAWTVTGDPKIRPVDVTAHPRGLLVLLEDGTVQLYGAKGTVAESWKPAAPALADEPGAAVSLAADPAGESVVCHANGVIARLAGDGRPLGVRGPALLAKAKRWAADGQGRVLALDVDYGLLSVLDGEGWRIARPGGTARSNGPFSEAGAMAATPDGSAIAVLDVDKNVVVRFDGRDLRKPPLIFGGDGSNNGQFKAPIAIAMDEAGRSYVLDEDLYRISAFDAGGQFLFAFGERGGSPNQLDEPVNLAVSPAGDALYVFDEDRYEVKKFALDQTAKAAKHAATGGGKGSEPGQFRAVVAMVVDRQGLLHALDTSRADWQTLDFRGQSLLPIAARPTGDLLRGAVTLAVSPDGTAWLVGGGGALGLR